MSEAERNMLTEDYHDIVNPQKISRKEKSPLDVLPFMMQYEKMRGDEHVGCHSHINRYLW